MSERISIGSDQATVYELDELAVDGEVTVSDKEGLDAESSWSKQLNENTDSGEKQNAGTVASGDDPEKSPSVSNGKNDNRKRGKASSKKRAASDPRKKGSKTTGDTAPKPKLSTHEKWAREHIAENVHLFDTYREYSDDGKSYEEVEVDVSEKTKQLIDARAKTAEASVRLRSGSLVYRGKKRQEELEASREEYLKSRREFLEEVLENSGAKTVAQKRALAALISAHEDGALMGEEAQGYLSEQSSTFRKLTEWYGNQSRPKQVLFAVGAAATGAALLGPIGGGAAAGTLVGSRFGRGYFTREARRQRSELTDDQRQRAREEEATLLQSNEKDYEGTYDVLRSYRKTGKGPRKIEDSDLANAAETRSDDLHRRSSGEYQDAAERAEEETKRKRISLGAAAVGALAGAGIGWAVERATDFNGILRGDGGPGITPEAEVDPSPDADAQSQIDDLERRLDEEVDRSEALDEQQQQEQERFEELQERQRELQANGEADADIEPEVSERSQYLYGELAGVEVDITIPEGSNVWNQLEAVVEQEMPNIPNDEKQRMVGNILNQLEQKYPSRDLNLVYPGEDFNIKLPS